MRIITLFSTILLLSSNLVTFAKSVSKVQTQAGYSHAHGKPDFKYPPHNTQQQVQRYLYTAFQRGSAEGNMRSQMSSYRFYFDPALNHYYVILESPGNSRMQLYFDKDSRYRLLSANLSMLEKQAFGSVGYIRVQVNGHNIISNHPAQSKRRFSEVTWNIANYVQDGINMISIDLEPAGGKFCLLGIKVETSEVLKGHGGGNDSSNLRFVQNVFRRVHFRYPTERESRYYTDLLDRGVKTRDEVRRMIECLDMNDQNDQFDALVVEYFTRYANRMPSDYEKSYFSRQLRLGQITLAQLRVQIERIANGGGGHSSNVEIRIRNEFRQVLNREPSDAELQYFSTKIRNGQMTWQQFDEELRRLQSGHFGPGLVQQEIIQFSFERSQLTSLWWNRFEQTDAYLLQLLLQRCNHEILHGFEADRKQVASQIASRIKTKYPGMK